MRFTCLLHGLNKAPITLPFPSSSSSSKLPPPQTHSLCSPSPAEIVVNGGRVIAGGRRRRSSVCQVGLPPVDPWSPSIDSQSVATQLFAVSLFPYIGFLYFITKSNSAPKLTLFGFYFLLAFVGATSLILTHLLLALDAFIFDGAVPAGIYAKVHYGTSLSNVDWLHGGAESLLTMTNLFIVVGLRQALRKASDADKTDVASDVGEEKESSI